MFRVGLVLGFLGVVFDIMASPLLNWLTTKVAPITRSRALWVGFFW